ncbi:12318_t:CDS:2, partial [Gigaspora margarita]
MNKKKLLIAYLDIIDYYCGLSFCNADNLFGIQKQTSLQLMNKSELDADIELESESELVANAELESASKLVAKAELENESELVANAKFENSKIWKILFYQSNDINNNLIDDKDSDYYYELLNSKNDNNSNKSDESIDNEENDYDSETRSLSSLDNKEIDYNSETRSLSSLKSLDTDKTTIKQLFEKVFINDGLTCNSPIEKAYYSAQIFSLLCFEYEDTDISTPIPATQYPLCTECTQKGVKMPT